MPSSLDVASHEMHAVVASLLPYSWLAGAAGQTVTATLADRLEFLPWPISSRVLTASRDTSSLGIDCPSQIDAQMRTISPGVNEMLRSVLVVLQLLGSYPRTLGINPAEKLPPVQLVKL